MTKKAKIKALEHENQALKGQAEALIENGKKLIDTIAECDEKINSLKSLVKKYENLNDGVPEDCKRGEWCKACEFGKPINVSDGPCGCISIRTVYFCGKGEACQHFVQKGLEK